MMFGEEISGKMLARWPTFFKPRILADCKNLHSNVHVDDLLSAQQNSNESGKYFLLQILFTENLETFQCYRLHNLDLRLFSALND